MKTDQKKPKPKLLGLPDYSGRTPKAAKQNSPSDEIKKSLDKILG